MRSPREQIRFPRRCKKRSALAAGTLWRKTLRRVAPAGPSIAGDEPQISAIVQLFGGTAREDLARFALKEGSLYEL
jgi:hypothetical protein